MRPSRVRVARRSFLRGVGAGFASLPFFKMLENSAVQAAGATLPLKFVTMYHPHGIAAELWAMQPGDTETSFNLTFPNSSLQPFDDAVTYGKSFKSSIIAIEGIDLLSNANGHDTAGTILTGSRIDSAAGKPLNSSLDQFLAVERQLGAQTPVTSIALGVGNDDTKSGSTLSYGPGGAALPKVIDPMQAFNLLFANFVVPSDPTAQAAANRQRLLGQSVIDFVNGDINRLRPRLAPREQAKLDAHLTALRELEKQISPSTTTCAAPPPPNARTFPMLRQYNGGEPYFDAITEAFTTLLAQAFACDITRFATLYMGDLSYQANPLMLPADNHGSVAHTYNGSAMGSDGEPVGAGDPKSWALLATFNKYAYSKVASFMKKLDQAGVLDSTLIYTSSDMGNPARHSTRNVPTILAGGANGKLRMGRRLQMAPDCPTSSPWCAPGDATFTATTNNHLLVSIAQAFGQSDVNSFGTQLTPDLTTNGLSNLT